MHNLCTSLIVPQRVLYVPRLFLLLLGPTVNIQFPLIFCLTCIPNIGVLPAFQAYVFGSVTPAMLG